MGKAASDGVVTTVDIEVEVGVADGTRLGVGKPGVELVLVDFNWLEARGRTEVGLAWGCVGVQPTRRQNKILKRKVSDRLAMVTIHSNLTANQG